MSTRATFPCPVPGCRRHITEGKLMCAAHWALVPPDWQNRVVVTWSYTRTLTVLKTLKEKLEVLNKFYFTTDCAIAAASRRRS